MSNRDENSKSVTPHTSDPVLAPFIASTFDPTAYINSALPTLGIATSKQPILPAKASSLPDVVTFTQTHIAQLSAQESRLVDTLTTITDEILRSGSRLAYEVELLRGEASTLEEVLSQQVKDDVASFVPEKPPTPPHSEAGGVSNAPDAEEDGDPEHLNGRTDEPEPTIPETGRPADPLAPPSLNRLRDLQQVRSSLQSVISTFDAALSFPLPPSLLSQSTSASSFVSVAAPADPAKEAAGQEALTRLRASIFDHLDTGKGGEGGTEGVAAAETRLEEIKELCKVWKGTSEEKARAKLVEGWERELEEAEEKLRTSMARGSAGRAPARESHAKKTEEGRREDSRNRGLFGQLRRLGDKVYLE